MLDHLNLEDDFPDRKRLTVLVSAASGLIGAQLAVFLQNQDHRVIKLVRQRTNKKDEIFWNPYSSNFRLPSDLYLDAVIHLSGENLSKGRWTKAKKENLIKSRIETTNNLINALKDLKHKPGVFVCASAIGYYGNRGDIILTEDDKPGNDFISRLTIDWEETARKAEVLGTRVVNLRTGVVLSLYGGALPNFLLPFKFGSGVIIGNGRQYLSWIAMEDLIRGIYYSLMNNNISGPVNLVAPNPVTNKNFNRVIGKIKRRPTLFFLPSILVKFLFGEMGKELLLSSTKVHPQKLLKADYKFRFPQLPEYLKLLLKRS